ncbi:hypothetical protein HYC85_027027 [Camellia sinensis]|uniref:Uncharacterized protein n=1 Tax=Camellia sinensis TaxID=4442 RepID=A0A7J7G8V8_CAMSI|nr:hypothetical protein HYC85_027027 [Camellia sinensis]
MTPPYSVLYNVMTPPYSVLYNTLIELSCFGSLSNHRGVTPSCYDEEKDTLAFSKVDSFLPDRVYYHGCLKFFLQITKRNGPELIYFGDHLYSDLRGPSKAGWRTAGIIHELELLMGNNVWHNTVENMRQECVEA